MSVSPDQEQAAFSPSEVCALPTASLVYRFLDYHEGCVRIAALSQSPLVRHLQTRIRRPTSACRFGSAYLLVE